MEDIVVPISEIVEIAQEIQVIAQKYAIQIPCYGHAGDGNLHATIVKNPRHSYSQWLAIEHQILTELYQLVRQKGGTISGEHGIGSKRREYLKMVCSPTEIALMKKIKQAIDPNGIMNPGKIF